LSDVAMRNKVPLRHFVRVIVYKHNLRHLNCVRKFSRKFLVKFLVRFFVN